MLETKISILERPPEVTQAMLPQLADGGCWRHSRKSLKEVGEGGEEWGGGRNRRDPREGLQKATRRMAGVRAQERDTGTQHCWPHRWGVSGQRGEHTAGRRRTPPGWEE